MVLNLSIFDENFSKVMSLMKQLLVLLVYIKKHDIFQILHQDLLKLFFQLGQVFLNIQKLGLFLEHHYFHKVDMQEL